MPFLAFSVPQHKATFNPLLGFLLNDIVIERCGGWTQKLISHLLQNCDICFKDSKGSQQSPVGVLHQINSKLENTLL